LGGTSDQLQFGRGVCLLYVENYHKDEAINAWIFDSYSTTCGANITIGTMGLMLLAGIAVARGYFFYRDEQPGRNVMLALFIVTAAWSALQLIFAIIMTTGVNSTCSEFVKSGKSCGAVFGEGFFEDTTKTIYYKNINTVRAAVGASFASFVFFALYSAFEYWSYRNSSLKWW
jgi:hypothetical protein